MTSTNLDPSAGNRRRVHRRCCLGHDQWSSTLESAPAAAGQTVQWV